MKLKRTGKVTSGTIENGLYRYKPIDKIDIREDSYKPDENKFSDWLKFCELYPNKDYMQFKAYCKEKRQIGQ
ncbi:hypothetical protein ES708_32278 [subsurface metagenome]